jgi:hypothetical protein
MHEIVNVASRFVTAFPEAKYLPTAILKQFDTDIYRIIHV